MTRSEKADRRKRIEALVRRAQRKALEHVTRDIQQGAAGDGLWEKRTIRDHVAVTLAQGAAAELGRKEAAKAAPKLFGVVFATPRIESGQEWESVARQVHEAARSQALEAVVVAPEPAAGGLDPAGSGEGGVGGGDPSAGG